MKVKKLLGLAISLTGAFALQACNNGGEEETIIPDVIEKEDVVLNTSSNSLYVKKVNNLKDDFIKGMDASSVIALENSGVSYYDFDGNKEDPLKILAENGINYIRVRVWNNPYTADGKGYGGGNCDIDTAVELGKRATKYGMKLNVDFHYSDFWADPAKQMVPKAWKDMEIEDKTEALYQYTKDCLTKLVKAGVDVGMVQIGNETNGKMCGEKIWFNIAMLMKSGSKACREVVPNAKIAVHFANPEKVTNYADYAFKLNYYELDYDVFGSSYYPYWHGTLDNLKTVLDNITDTYGKEVMVLETSYCYTPDDSDFFGNTIGDGSAVDKPYQYTVQGQASMIRDVINTVSEMKKGIGVMYWEGTWISVGGSDYDANFALWEKYGSGWASSAAKEYDPNDAGKYYGGTAVDNQAFFDAHGKALESLKVWNLVNSGNEVEEKADAIEDVNIVCDLNGTIELPTNVNAIMNNGSKKSIPVTWHNVDLEEMYSGGVKKYTIEGTAGGMTAKCYISMVEYNFLHDYSFEDDSTYWDYKDIGGKMNELYIENKATDSLTGTKHLHFWSSASNSVEFYCEQKVENLPAGTYKFSISIMGGDAGETEIYSYVKINGEIKMKKALTITSYGNWDTEVISGIEYNGTDEIIVGIYVKCAGANNGAWGKIDDALLNSMK